MCYYFLFFACYIFFKLFWCLPFYFLKKFAEVGIVFEIEFVGNFSDRVVPDGEQPFCFQYYPVAYDFSCGGTQLFLAQRIQVIRSEEHTSELQSRENLVCRLLLE